MRDRFALQVGTRCDNRCEFCAQAGLELGPPSDIDALLERARADADELTFVGGEPTLHAELPRWIERARALMEKEGAESIDAARQQWWIGLRDAEEAKYDSPEGGF